MISLNGNDQFQVVLKVDTDGADFDGNWFQMMDTKKKWKACSYRQVEKLSEIL